MPIVTKNWKVIAQLITYFGKFVSGFLSLRLRDFLYYVFRLQGKTGKTKIKNKQTHMQYFRNFVAKNNQKPSYENGMKNSKVRAN